MKSELSLIENLVHMNSLVSLLVCRVRRLPITYLVCHCNPLLGPLQFGIVKDWFNRRLDYFDKSVYQAWLGSSQLASYAYEKGGMD